MNSVGFNSISSKNRLVPAASNTSKLKQHTHTEPNNNNETNNYNYEDYTQKSKQVWFELDKQYFCPLTINEAGQFDKLKPTNINLHALTQTLNLITNTAEIPLEFEYQNTEEEEIKLQQQLKQTSISSSNNDTNKNNNNINANPSSEDDEIMVIGSIINSPVTPNNNNNNESSMTNNEPSINNNNNTNNNNENVPVTKKSRKQTSLIANMETLMYLFDWVDVSLNINSTGEISVELDILSYNTRYERVAEYQLNTPIITEIETLLASYYTQVLINNSAKTNFIQLIQQSLLNEPHSSVTDNQRKYEILDEFLLWENEKNCGDSLDRKRRRDKTYVSDCSCTPCINQLKFPNHSNNENSSNSNSTSTSTDTVMKTSNDNPPSTPKTVSMDIDINFNGLQSPIKSSESIFSYLSTSLQVPTGLINFSRLTNAIKNYVDPIELQQKTQTKNPINAAESLAANRLRRLPKQTHFYSPPSYPIPFPGIHSRINSKGTNHNHSNRNINYEPEYTEEELALEKEMNRNCRLKRISREALAREDRLKVQYSQISLKTMKTPANAHKAVRINQKSMKSNNVFSTPQPKQKKYRRPAHYVNNNTNHHINNSPLSSNSSSSYSIVKLSPVHRVPNHLCNPTQFYSSLDLTDLAGETEEAVSKKLDDEIPPQARKQLLNLMSWHWDKQFKADFDMKKAYKLFTDQQKFSQEVTTDENGNIVRSTRARATPPKNNNNTNNHSDTNNLESILDYEPEPVFDYENHINHIQDIPKKKKKRLNLGPITSAQLLLIDDRDSVMLMRVKVVERLKPHTYNSRQHNKQQSVPLPEIQQETYEDLEDYAEPEDFESEEYEIYFSRSGRPCKRLKPKTKTKTENIQEPEVEIETKPVKVELKQHPTSKSKSKVKPVAEDDMCGVCGDYGDLIVCDGEIEGQLCQRCYHKECVHLEEVPKPGHKYICARHWCATCHKYGKNRPSKYCEWCTLAYCLECAENLEFCDWIPKPGTELAQWFICEDCITYYLKYDNVDFRDPLRQIESAETIIRGRLEQALNAEAGIIVENEENNPNSNKKKKGRRGRRKMNMDQIENNQNQEIDYTGDMDNNNENEEKFVTQTNNTKSHNGFIESSEVIVLDTSSSSLLLGFNGPDSELEIGNEIHNPESTDFIGSLMASTYKSEAEIKNEIELKMNPIEININNKRSHSKNVIISAVKRSRKELNQIRELEYPESGPDDDNIKNMEMESSDTIVPLTLPRFQLNSTSSSSTTSSRVGHSSGNSSDSDKSFDNITTNNNNNNNLKDYMQTDTLDSLPSINSISSISTLYTFPNPITKPTGNSSPLIKEPATYYSGRRSTRSLGPAASSTNNIEQRKRNQNK